MNSFIGYEVTPNYPVGRPLKLDRQEIIAVAVSLREWINMDHEARIAEHWQRAEHIENALATIPHVTTTRVSEARTLGNGVRITLDEQKLGKSASRIIEALRDGTPGIRVGGGGNSIYVSVANLVDDDVEVISERLRTLLTA
jgi:L-seryl-tRNA(Ser) seleniumtransferase